MTVKIFRNEKFDFPHENIVFDEMIGELEKQWSDSKDLVVMLGNIYTNGTQIDALIVKKDAISIIDFKNYGGEISFSENGSWKANGVEIKMSGRINPYLQILNAKFSLVDKLKTNPIFKKGNEVNLGHISGIVLFHQHIKFDSHSIPPRISWFHVTDIFNSVKLLDNITSKQIKLSDQEIECFSGLFDLKEYEFSRPKITIEEDKFINRELLINELIKLDDIHNSIDLAKNAGDSLVKSYNAFISYFYPDRKPADELEYHLNHYHNNYEKRQREFILRQNEILKQQIGLIYNLNSNNGYILNEFINDEDLKEYFAVRINTKKIIPKIQEKFDLNKPTAKLSLSTYKAYFNIFYERGIFSEQPFGLIRKEVLQREKLINYLHGLYTVLNKWFGSDMILQHEIYGRPNTEGNACLDDYQNQDEELLYEDPPEEIFTSIREYKFARGISERWYSKLISTFGGIQNIQFYDENFTYNTVIDSKSIEKIPIAKVKLPSMITSFFKKIHTDISGIISQSDLDEILNLFDLKWILDEWLDVRDLHVINLKTHLIFSNLLDFDYLKKSAISPNAFLYEPFYLTCLEQIGCWDWEENVANSESFRISYKTLSEDYISDIKALSTSYSILPPYDLRYYKRFKYLYEYPFPNSNKISLDDVVKECDIPINELVEFLSSVFPDYKKKQQVLMNAKNKNANKEYKILLKRFKSIKSELPIKTILVAKSNKSAIIGYYDIKKYIKKRLEPFKNPEQAKRFALKKIGGVILYGPPGCGKTLWATQIAKYLGLKFEEIPRSIFGSTYVDGAMKGLENKLDEVEKMAPIAIFFDEFDSVGTARENESGSNDENRKVVNTLLQRIPKLIEKGIIVLAATNFINDLDSALIRPGRFDLHIPIMLPLPKERAEIIHHYLTENLPEAVLRILSNNSANDSDYWKDYTELMFLFSNSHVLDFCNELKDYMYEQSDITELDEIVLTDDVIFDLINRVKSKIRKKDIDLHKRFYAESINLMDVFKDRMERLKYEIDKFDNNKGNNYRPVGFKPQK